MPVAILHKGRNGCGEVAFHYAHAPVPGEKLRSKDATTIAGEPVEAGSPIMCESCKAVIDKPSSSWAKV